MMMKRLLLLALLLLSVSSSLAAFIRRREDAKGSKGITETENKPEATGVKSIRTIGKKLQDIRNLKGGHKGYYGFPGHIEMEDDDGYGDYGYYGYHKKKGKKGKSKRKGKGKKGGKKGYGKSGSGSRYYAPKQPKCHRVVEPVEFYMEPPLETIFSPNSTNSTTDTVTPAANNRTRNLEDADAGADGDPQDIGTRWVFQGPLLEFDDHDGLVRLDDFFVSGVCTRTWENFGDEGIPGAAYCSYTFTIDTGASINMAGEVFDGWDSNISIEGGTFELIGVGGQVTLTPLNEFFNPLDLDEDFFEDSEVIRGRGTLIYDICPEDYWDMAMERFEELDSSSDEGTFPDPFSLED